MFSARAAVHGTMKISPGSLVYQRDMFLDIPLISDLEILRQKREIAINNNLMIANRKRISHDYAVNDLILKLAYKPNKLAPRAEGPYQIVQVHTNGTVTIQLRPHVTERINIRRIRPYRH